MANEPKQYYLGNQNLKSANFPVEFTKENIEEYVRCARDPLYFIRNYIKIVTLDFGIVPFKTYPFQEEFIQTLHDNRFVLGMFPRQYSKTTCVSAYLVWYIIFNANKNCLILANKAVSARQVMSKIKEMYEYLPKWIQQGVLTWNKGTIELENGSKIHSAATSPSAARGMSINLLYIDESAFIPSTVADEFFTSAYPTISSGKTTKIIQTSTPIGYNHWWKFWTEAEKGENNFIPFRVTWDMIPGRDINWYNEQMAALGPIKVKQEVECEFLGSSFTLINAVTLGQMSATAPIYRNEGFDILDKPKIGNTYIMVVDTSEGVGGDYSAFTVIDVTELPYTVVAKYRNNTIGPLLYPTVIYEAAKHYNNAFLLMEINRSEQVAYILHQEYEYENILYVTRSKRGGQIISEGFGNGNSAYGVQTDKRVKRVGCANVKTLIESGKLLITDAEIISEISTFVEKRASYAADDGYHDDLIMTLVLFGWLTTQDYFKLLLNVDIRKSLFEAKQKALEDQIVPVGYRITGQEEEPVKAEVIDGDYWVYASSEES